MPACLGEGSGGGSWLEILFVGGETNEIIILDYIYTYMFVYMIFYI